LHFSNAFFKKISFSTYKKYKYENLQINRDSLTRRKPHIMTQLDYILLNDKKQPSLPLTIDWDTIEPTTIMAKTPNLTNILKHLKKPTKPEEKDYYNVYIYQLLPYPPHVKDPHKPSTNI